jgi:peptidoglycan/xylan/chitin deacetylase (PgdA/CDA1 family)
MVFDHPHFAKVGSMNRYSRVLTKAALSSLYHTRAHALLAPIARGVGVILTLHQVSREPVRAFDPNRILRVSPEFLESTILQVRQLGLETVSIDEAHRRMVQGDFEQPFVSFTLDDGYRDNLVEALPIFRRHNVPCCIYVPSDFPDGRADLWWLALEHVIATVDQITVKMEGAARPFVCAKPQQKTTTFNTIYWWLRRLDEDEARRIVAELARGIGWDPREQAAKLLMTWDEIRQLAADPLVTIGAHTIGHYALAKLPAAQAAFEIDEGAQRLARELGARPRHLSFPYGSAAAAGPREFQIARELGFNTAVTTRKGLVHADHAEHMFALPRVSLNGEFAHPNYLSVLLSGAPFALMRRFNKLDVA